MHTHTKKRVVVGMSGGVDSSVAAWLLKDAGYEVIGLFIRSWPQTDPTGQCTAANDFRYVRRVAQQLGIPYYTINLEKEYEQKVFQYFLQEYRAGRTPNPDILCNREIKFGHFADAATQLRADYIATGHYAQIDRRGDDQWLLQGRDEHKDQTYFLYAINRQRLVNTIFPIGSLEKKEVRRIAADLGLASAHKRDSTGICFIENKNLRPFLKNYIPYKYGKICTLDGVVKGTHPGIAYYTLGQRHGLGIGGDQSGDGRPWFVIGKDVAKNILFVGQGHDHPALYSERLTATSLNWLTKDRPLSPFYSTAKCRYRQAAQAALVEPNGHDQVVVTFEQPQWAVTPGQSIVLYDGERCLGGGIIETRGS